MLPGKFATASFNIEGTVIINLGLFYRIEDNHLICLWIWSLLSIWLFWLGMTLMMMMMMISSLSSYLIWLSHCHHSLYDCDYYLTVIMTLMMISSLGDDITLLMISLLSSYSIWLDPDDFNTVIILDMTMMMILSHIKYNNSDEIFMIVTLTIFTEIIS